MSGAIELTAITSGTHYLLFGSDSSKTMAFEISMYIEKFGPRALEWFQALNLGFASFLGADIWIHNSDDVPRDNFYGEQKDSVVGLIANQEQGTVRTLDSIAIQSNSEWDVYEVVIPVSVNYPDGMFSKIPLGRFKKREGVLFAEFLRNMKSTDSTARTIDALKGEVLRGECAYIKMRNTSTSQFKLFRVTVNMTTSKI
jgi:hypothetical protein